MQRLVREDPAGCAARQKASLQPPGPHLLDLTMPEDGREDPSNFMWGEECVSYPFNQNHVYSSDKDLAFLKL